MLGSPDDGPMSQSLGGFPGFEFSQTTGFDRIGSHGATCASAAVTQPRISAANPTPTTAANRHAPSAHHRSTRSTLSPERLTPRRVNRACAIGNRCWWIDQLESAGNERTL